MGGNLDRPRALQYQLRNLDGSLSPWIPGKVICVAKNYAEHAAELRDAVPKQPTFFIKPNTSLCDLDGTLHLPTGRGVVHHELELGLLIGKRCSRGDKADLGLIAGCVLALDLTLRSLQTQLREQGYPWEAAKAFRGACPVSPVLDRSIVAEPKSAVLRFDVNGSRRQAGNTGDMVFGIPRLLADAAEIFTFEPGDILLTGTPAGVGPLSSGDEFRASVNEWSCTGEVA